MISTLKQKLRAWLFKNYLAEQEVKVKAEIEKHKASINVSDYIIGKLKGFNPKLIDGIKVDVDTQGNIDISSSVIEDAIKSGMAEDEFLAEAKCGADNRAIPIIVNYFIRNQIMMTFRTARSLEENNFGRALVGGIELLPAELTRLKTIFDEKNAKPDEFDRTEAL